MTRYAVVIDLYVYAESDEEAIKEAEEIAKGLDIKDDCQARVLTMHEAKVGKIGEQRIVK